MRRFRVLRGAALVAALVVACGSPPVPSDRAPAQSTAQPPLETAAPISQSPSPGTPPAAASPTPTAKSPSGTPRTDLTPPVELGRSAASPPLTPKDVIEGQARLVDAVRLLNRAQLAAITAVDVGAPGEAFDRLLREVSAQATRVGVLSMAISRAALAGDSPGEVAADAVAAYSGIGRLALVIVLEVHDLRDGLTVGGLAPKALVPVVADSAARLWALPAGGPGTVRPPNPFLAWLPDAGSIGALVEIGPDGAAAIQKALGVEARLATTGPPRAGSEANLAERPGGCKGFVRALLGRRGSGRARSPTGRAALAAPCRLRPSDDRQLSGAGGSRSRVGGVHMPVVASSVSELLDRLAGSATVDDDHLVVGDPATFRGEPIRDLAWTATFSADARAVETARWLVWEASQQLGAPSASIHELYMARGRGECGGFTVPAINLRTQVFDMARVVLETARSCDVGALILELARSEQEYTYQRPAEYATNVLAGAIAAGWHGPVFVQGDHYQFNAAKYGADPEATTATIRKATAEAIAAGYRNIDIDSSTLVDLSHPSVDEQQRVNYSRAAELTALIRSLEPAGVVISVGGEIGEVGKKNSTEEELAAYLSGYRLLLDDHPTRLTGLSKVSVQTGTTHGGIPLPGGGVAQVALDFGVLERLGDLARRQGLAGCVQHGASTLPDELFHRFPAVETAEIHLATGFQNLLYEHGAFPSELAGTVREWCFVNTADERKPGETDDQFVYKTRKKALGPLKRELWDLPTRFEILADQAAKFAFLFGELRVNGTMGLVAKYVTPAREHRARPEALRATESAAGPPRG